VKCQYICNLGLEDEHKCLVPLSGEEWRYCGYHRESGPKQYTALTNGEFIEAYREICKDDEDYRDRRKMEQFRVRHRLTQPKLTAFFDRVEDQQEYDPCSKYEGYEYALKKLHESQCLILDPPADLPSAAALAGDKTQELLAYLEEGQLHAPDDPDLKRLILATKELQRDIGQWMSARTFTTIGGKAKSVRELCQKLAEPLVFGHGLFVDVEIARIKYFAYYAKPKKRQFYANQARSALSGAEAFCDMLVERSKGERRQLADFLRFYVDAIRVRQAFDAEELAHIDLHMQAVDHRAMDFAYAYGEGQIDAIVQFLTAMHHAEHELVLGHFDRTSEYLKEAEDISKTMQWHSIETQHRFTCVKTTLALADMDSEYEPEECVQNYLKVINRYPCFEYRHGLRALKRIHRSQVPDAHILTRKDLFVDTTFTHILPFVMPIYVGQYKGVEGCGEEAISREYESEVMVSV
jgi:hypothetical protein